MLQNFARQDITLQKNPFIVNHWFNILEETVKKLGIKTGQISFGILMNLACLVNPRNAKSFPLKDKKLSKL